MREKICQQTSSFADKYQQKKDLMKESVLDLFKLAKIKLAIKVSFKLLRKLSEVI